MAPGDRQRGGRWSKWLLVAAYWTGQAIALPIVIVLISDESASVADIAGALGDPEFYPPWAISVAVLTLLQGVFLWPVRRPKPAASRGWSVRISLAVAGLGAALLFVGLLFAVLELIEQIRYSAGGQAGGEAAGASWQWALWGGLATGWLVATLLLISFCRKGARETLLGRVAAGLFIGTVVEAAAVIPLDVMVRKRTDCYCGEGTFFTLLICGGVGMFALGPAIWLPLLARRRKRWYGGRCDACGYDMRGLEQAERCPECGTGWEAAD